MNSADKEQGGHSLMKIILVWAFFLVPYPLALYFLYLPVSYYAVLAYTVSYEIFMFFAVNLSIVSVGFKGPEDASTGIAFLVFWIGGFIVLLIIAPTVAVAGNSQAAMKLVHYGVPVILLAPHIWYHLQKS